VRADAVTVEPEEVGRPGEVDAADIEVRIVVDDADQLVVSAVVRVR